MITGLEANDLTALHVEAAIASLAYGFDVLGLADGNSGNVGYEIASAWP